MLKIYADPITVNCRKVLAGLELVGTDFEVVAVDYFAGGHTAADYLALNPNGTLPTATDGNFVLWESNAILQYAAEKAGNTNAYPSEPQTRADINRWLLWESSSWFPCCYQFLVENCAKPLMGADTDEAVLAEATEKFHKLAAILDARLDGQDWLCGDAPTIADIAVAAPIHMHGEAKIPLAAHANLERWMTNSVEQLQCWENTWVGPGFTLERPAS